MPNEAGDGGGETRVCTVAGRHSVVFRPRSSGVAGLAVINDEHL